MPVASHQCVFGIHRQQFHAREAGGAAHAFERAHAGTEPVIELAAQLIGLVELQGGNFAAMVAPGPAIGDEGFDESHAGGQAADNFERQKRVFQVVQNAQAEDDIEAAETGGGDLVKIEIAVLGARVEALVQLQVIGELDAIDGGDGSPMPFGFEAEPAVPGADIEQTPAGKIGRNGEPRPALPFPFQGHASFNALAIGEFEAVVPALLLGELAAEIVLPPALVAHGERLGGGRVHRAKVRRRPVASSTSLRRRPSTGSLR